MPDFTNVFMHIYAKRGVLSSETIVFGVGRSFVVVFEKNMMIGFSPLWGARKKTTKGYVEASLSLENTATFTTIILIMNQLYFSKHHTKMTL